MTIILEAPLSFLFAQTREVYTESIPHDDIDSNLLQWMEVIVLHLPLLKKKP